MGRPEMILDGPGTTKPEAAVMRATTKPRVARAPCMVKAGLRRKRAAGIGALPAGARGRLVPSALRVLASGVTGGGSSRSSVMSLLCVSNRGHGIC